MTTLRDMQRQAWEVAEAKGLHQDLATMAPRQTTMIRLALLQTEVTEALDELLEPLEAILRLLMLHRQISHATQRVKKEAFPGVKEALGKELADIVIRAGDLAAALQIDLETCVDEKQAFNAQRPYQFGTPDEVKRASSHE